MPSNRCTTCGINWPVGTSKCYGCFERTDYVTSASALSPQETQKLKSQLAFERFYEKWDADRKGPTPEEIGAQEAKEILDLHAIPITEDDDGSR